MLYSDGVDVLECVFNGSFWYFEICSKTFIEGACVGIAIDPVPRTETLFHTMYPFCLFGVHI